MQWFFLWAGLINYFHFILLQTKRGNWWNPSIQFAKSHWQRGAGAGACNTNRIAQKTTRLRKQATSVSCSRRRRNTILPATHRIPRPTRSRSRKSCSFCNSKRGCSRPECPWEMCSNKAGKPLLAFKKEHTLHNLKALLLLVTFSYEYLCVCQILDLTLEKFRVWVLVEPYALLTRRMGTDKVSQTMSTKSEGMVEVQVKKVFSLKSCAGNNFDSTVYGTKSTFIFNLFQKSSPSMLCFSMLSQIEISF